MEGLSADGLAPLQATTQRIARHVHVASRQALTRKATDARK